MDVVELELAGLKLIRPKRFEDGRGFFQESYRQSRYVDAGIECDFVQGNHSFSRRGVVRGMHFQRGVGQAKLVSCMVGEIFDVAVDMRPESATYMQWTGVRLSGAEQLFVPEGFAHGFCVLSEEAHVSYLVSTEFDGGLEGEFRFDDSDIGIEWPVDDVVVSDRDRVAPYFRDLRVWIVGKSGQLASALCGLLPEATATGRNEVDVCDEAAVIGYLDSSRPLIVINASGYTQVDRAESEPELARALNVDAVERLGRLCGERGIKFLHISTDFVFDGEKEGAYVEGDGCAPVSVYGATKREGEEALLAVNPDALVVRTSWVYGQQSGFARAMRGLMEQHEELRVVDDQVGRPTEVGALAEAVWRLRRESGLFHFASGEPMSRYDWAKRVWEATPGVCKRLIPVKSREFQTAAVRPKNSVLDTSKYEGVVCEN